MAGFVLWPLVPCRLCVAKSLVAASDSRWSVIVCPLCRSSSYLQFLLSFHSINHDRQKITLPGGATLKDLQKCFIEFAIVQQKKCLTPEVASWTTKDMILQSAFQPQKGIPMIFWWLMSRGPWSLKIPKIPQRFQSIQPKRSSLTWHSPSSTPKFVISRYYQIQCMLELLYRFIQSRARWSFSCGSL